MCEWINIHLVTNITIMVSKKSHASKINQQKKQKKTESLTEMTDKQIKRKEKKQIVFTEWLTKTDKRTTDR